MHSLQKFCPVYAAKWLSDAIGMVKYEVCWPMGSASTGRAPHQLTESPYKYFKSIENRR